MNGWSMENVRGRRDRLTGFCRGGGLEGDRPLGRFWIIMLERA